MKKYTMTDYVHLTREVIEDNLNKGILLVKNLMDAYESKMYKSVVLVASGSSYTACQCARLFLAKTLKTDVKVIMPYTFYNYDIDLISEKDFVLIVSQSGASVNCIDCLKELKKRGFDAYGLSSDKNCEMAQYADQVFEWGCGTETVGYVTLGPVSLIACLYLFAAYETKDEDFIAFVRSQIFLAMKNHKEVCDKTTTFIQQHYRSLMEMDKVYVLGSGCNYGTALEGALKIGETVKVLAVGYEQDEFLHGPAIQLNPKYSLFVIDGVDHTKQHALQVFEALQKATDHVYMITGQNVEHPNVLHVNASCEEPFTCLYYLPFFQLIAEVISMDTGSKKMHPCYLQFANQFDFRTEEYRKTHQRQEE